MDWSGAADSGGAYGGARELDVSVQQPAQTHQPQESDDGGPWQVVTRRRSRHRRQQSSAGKGDVQEKIGASVSQLPENSSADTGVTRQSQRLQSNGPVSVLSTIPASCRPLCTNSFAQLGKLDWVSFEAWLKKCDQSLTISVTKNDFLRLLRMMKLGPQAIRRADDTVFLAPPFKVLLFGGELPHVLFLSLVFECAVPGFLVMLGKCFVCSLPRLDREQELFTPIIKLLVQICEGSEHWLDRLGWQVLSMRHRCALFSNMALLLKSTDKVDLIRSLHRQVSGLWLKKHHYVVVQRFSCETVPSNPYSCLRDLKASLLANVCGLGDRFFTIPETGMHRQLIVSYVDIVESVIGVLNRLDLPPNDLLFGVWQIIAQWTVRFRLHLSVYLGFDQTIALLNGVLHHIRSWSELEKAAFELRLTLLATALTKCEELLLKRDGTLICQTWNQYEKEIESLLGQCHQFIRNDDDDNQPLCAQRKDNEAWFNLLLRESKFHRLGCEIRRTSRQQIQEKLQEYRQALTEEWALSRGHQEAGAIELAKWYFLAEEHDAAVSTLMGECFTLVNTRIKKADLLARYGEYQTAIDEYRQVKQQITDQRKQDEVDARIAMLQLRWYEAENNTDHLAAAYQLSVALLGRCHIQDRNHFEGGLAHIVNAMKNSGLKFTDYAGQTLALGFLVNEGCTISSWSHFADLLYIRHKVGLTEADTVHKLANKIRGKHHIFFDLGKMA